jgi:hypothetical protein
MNRPPFTLEIHPRAWYALANLPKEAYARIQAGLAAVAENAAHASADGVGHFVSLDGFLARYQVQVERRCVTVLDVERAAHAPPPLATASARNVMDVPGAREDALRAAEAPGASGSELLPHAAARDPVDC